MVPRILFAAILCLVPTCAIAQADTGPASDVAAIHQLIDNVDTASNPLKVT